MTVKDRIRTTLGEALRPEALDVIDESHQHAGHMGSRAGGETHFRGAGDVAGLRREKPCRPPPDDQRAARR